jgi:hypothetical protein
MSECGRCPEKRENPLVLCGLMLTDRHCAAALDLAADMDAYYAKRMACLSYQCKHGQCRTNTRGLCWFDQPKAR